MAGKKCYAEQKVKEYKTVQPGKKMSLRPDFDIAVIGMSGRFPGAQNYNEFWTNLKNGVESISFFSDEELEEVGISSKFLEQSNFVKARSVLDDIEYFDAAFFGYSPMEAKKMDPQIRILHECAWEALEDAGYDSEKFKGAIGFFVGANGNTAWQVKVFLSGANGSTAADRFDSSHYIDRDHISTRISYKLNLIGPSFTLETQCSTSMVAVHQACQSLLGNECDMALAGGIAITLPQKNGYLFEKGMILSPDGHTRAFDANAQGSNFGNGAGIVVLKPITSAIEDGDSIRAVVKSSFINNDGKRKVGYSAPSVRGQEEVIRTALELAEVETESISYIEAHGTATPLGDQIEIEALKRVFKTGREKSCRIGTVKTNVGHLDNAAGVTGFIKTVLSLKHRLIPGSLHYERPNPEIDFGNSPFYVNKELAVWENGKYPLRAGVNSFGVGGTNVHVVLEEAPKLENSTQGRYWKLVLLSAKSESALNKVVENFAVFLEESPGAKLSDVAYTLQVGRRAFPQRLALVCSNIDDAVAALTVKGKASIDEADSSKSFLVQNFLNRNENRELFFMFSGIGSQYVNMGLDLYENEIAFREEVDHCLEILRPLVKEDLKAILFPHPDLVAMAEEKMRQSDINMVLIFVFEYALARLLMKWGLKPDAMIGYSFGEYAAACLAGVFSLEDALKLIVFRGQLIQSTEEGSMLSVPIPLGKLKKILDEDLSIAIDNGSSCVISGSRMKVDAFGKKLKKMKYLCLPLQTSQAVHSSLMEPILKQYEDKIRQMKLHRPAIPYISNVSGTWITPEEATGPHYWSRHFRETVKFAAGIKELIKKTGGIFIEVGPGRDLSTMLGRYIDNGSDQHVLNLVRPSQKKISDVFYLLNKVALLWLYGIKIDWCGFYSNEKRSRISLPTYPFERQRYWIDDDGDPAKRLLEMRSRQLSSVKMPDLADWFSLFQWERSQIRLDKPLELPEKSCHLLFVNRLDFCIQMLNGLHREGKTVIVVEEGVTFSKTSEQSYSIDPSQRTDYEILLNEIASMNMVPTIIVHLWSVGQEYYSELDYKKVNEAQEKGLYSILYLVQAIGKKKWNEKFNVNIVTNNVHEILGDEELCPEKATVLGLAKSVQQEFVNIKCRCIDIVLPQSGSPQEKCLIDQLLKEFTAQTSDTVISYRGNYRWVEVYKPFRLEKIEGTISRLKEKGVYLITGGLGYVGFLLAKFLAGNYRAKLLLIGRTPLPPREEWNGYLANHEKKDRISKKISKVLELEELGSEVLAFGTNLVDEERIGQIIEDSEDRMGPINGLIHAAGILSADTFRVVSSLTKEQFQAQFQPKIYGLLVLEKIFREKHLDFSVLVSSPASILGGLSFAAYAAANIFVDAFAYYFNRNSASSWITVNWADWEEEEKYEKKTSIGDSVDAMLMTREEGVETFRRILYYYPRNQVLVSAGDMQDRFNKWVKLESFQDQMVENRKDTASLRPRPNLIEPYEKPSNFVEETLADIWINFFGFEKIGIHDDFFELGGDSLKAITIIANIHKRLNVQIPLIELFNMPTIEKLGKYIESAQKSEYLSINPVEKKEYYLLSSAQKRLYVLQQLGKDCVVYNETMAYLKAGELDREKFKKALIKLVQRHEVLRTAILIENGELVQKILPEVEVSLEYYEMDGGKVENLVNDFIKPFDLGEPPFFRILLVKISRNEHLIIRDMHHIITDGISNGMFIYELMRFYEGIERDLPRLKLHYKDYSTWQKEQRENKTMRDQEVFWLKVFEDDIPVLSLPIDFPRPPVQSFEGDFVNFELHKGQEEALKKIALEKDVTIYMLLLAVFNIFLSKISGQEDIIIGTSVAGRRHEDLQNIIGVFVNTLALRNYPEKEKLFNVFLSEIKERTLAAFENQDFQFEDLIEKLGIPRDMSRNPLFDVQFVLQAFNGRTQDMSSNETNVKNPDLNLKGYGFINRVSKFDLRMEVNEIEGRLFFAFEYCSKLFERETVERFSNYFKEIVSCIVDDGEIRLRDISVSHELSEVESGYQEDQYDHFNV